MFTIENVFEKRAEFKKACKRAKACKKEFRKLLKAETKAEFIQVIFDNFFWVYGDVSKFGLDYDYVSSFNEGFARVKKNYRWGFINTKFEQVCELEYDYVDCFDDGFAGVRIGKKWGFIDTKFKEICDVKYDDVGCLIEGFARVLIGKQYGILGCDGKEVYEVKYTLPEVIELLKELRKCSH